VTFAEEHELPASYNESNPVRTHPTSRQQWVTFEDEKDLPPSYNKAIMSQPFQPSNNETMQIITHDSDATASVTTGQPQQGDNSMTVASTVSAPARQQWETFEEENDLPTSCNEAMMSLP
jgi:hypothetical protein